LEFTLTTTAIIIVLLLVICSFVFLATNILRTQFLWQRNMNIQKLLHDFRCTQITLFDASKVISDIERSSILKLKDQKDRKIKVDFSNEVLRDIGILMATWRHTISGIFLAKSSLSLFETIFGTDDLSRFISHAESQAGELVDYAMPLMLTENLSCFVFQGSILANDELHKFLHTRLSSQVKQIITDAKMELANA
jgi:hypothetical protein